MTTKYVPCQNDDIPVFTGFSDVKTFIKEPLREMESGTNKNVLREMKVMQKHLNRKANEVVFMKFSDLSCSIGCPNKPWKASQVQDFLQKRDFKLFRPEESAEYPGHYVTFLEMCRIPASDVKDDDENQSSVAAKALGRCERCPSYSFTSKTEQARGIHPCTTDTGNPRRSLQLNPGKEFTCNHKTAGAIYVWYGIFILPQVIPTQAEQRSHPEGIAAATQENCQRHHRPVSTNQQQQQQQQQQKQQQQQSRPA